MFKKIFFNVTKCSVMESLYIYTLHVLWLEYSLYVSVYPFSNRTRTPEADVIISIDNIMVLSYWGGQKSNTFLSSKSSQRYLKQNSNFVNFRCCYFNLLWTSNKKLWKFFLNGGSLTSPKIILLQHM